MATLADRLTQLEWLFYEKGMMHVYNELRSMANAANNTQLGADPVTFGTIDYTSNCAPDVTERVKKSYPEGFTDRPLGTQNGGRPPTQGV